MRKKADFLDARAVSGIVNAHIQYRRIANPTKRAEGRQTTVAICDTGPNDKVEDKTTLNRGTGERAKICAG